MRWNRTLLTFLFVFCSLSFLVTKITCAAGENQFVTIVNPVRISQYSSSISENIKAQYKYIGFYDLSATWLLTYDAIVNPDVHLVMQKMDKNQEMGIFLEVTENFAKAAGVGYNDTGSWHHATSVFLSGYSQEDRMKLIDVVFGEFINCFGYYPKSVGSWWTDSFSLDYMDEKYGIEANLGCSDQFSTDGYQIWGQYWSTPFYPSKFHAGIPATDESAKLDIVTTQWAARDPVNGYKSSLFSTQDYYVADPPNDISYFEKLVWLYSDQKINRFGHITVGLESDLSPDSYDTNFKQQLEVVAKLRGGGFVQVLTMEQFSGWYKENFPTLSPSQFIYSDDLLGNNQKVFWYQSPTYRIAILEDKETKKVKIFDFRSYHADLQEPYYMSANKEFSLHINVPSYFDEISNSEDIWDITKLGFEKIDSVVLSEDNESVEMLFGSGKRMTFSQQKIILDVPLAIIPDIIKKAPQLEVEKISDGKVEIAPKKNWIVSRDGVVFRGLTDVATHLLSGKKVKAIIFSFLLAVLFLLYKIKQSGLSAVSKFLLYVIIISMLAMYAKFWYQKNSMEYFVSQSEIDALFRLSFLPKGRVLVYDNECLGCEWHTPEKPAVFANKRSYVRGHGKHQIIYNSSVFEADNQAKAKEEFDKLDVDYIYLAKYEDYIEKTPFSPGDLGIEKIYANANAEIWRVIK